MRYPDYWFNPDNGITPLDGMIWRIIRESSTKRIAMETGELQYGDRFTPEDTAALAADPRFVVNNAPSLTPFAIKLNNQVGPTSDINVRKALSHAFDYDAAIEAIEPVMVFCAPCPTASMAITAATPMTIPRMVKPDRSLLELRLSEGFEENL